MHCILLLQQGAIKDKPELFHSMERNMQYLERGTKWPIDSERQCCVDSCWMVIQIYDTLAENVIKAAVYVVCKQ